MSAAMFSCIATNPFHHLYYTEFGKGNILYGGMFYIFQIIFYIFIISGISLMFIRHTQRNDVVTAQTMLLALAAAVPLMVNILSVSGIIRSKIEVTPLCFAFSVIMILIAISRYGLLNVNRIAINDTIDKIAIAVIVFDEDDNMTYKNKMTDSIIQIEENTTLPEFRKKLSELSGTELDDETISKELKIGDEYYNFRQSISVNKKGAEIARIIMINNVSEYYELAAAENKLSLELERNRIAQEI
ncbi:MAG: two-component sensor histidine kinase, partial [Clostridia bacterium]|nr:two-component sensor histidine kinase [Clostridia bacterium]